MQRNAQPLTWRPRGVSDTLDASDTFQGAMAQLQNLIPDPTTKQVWQCRPAAQQLTAFGGFTTPGFISGLYVVGNFAFGMVATGAVAGRDQPFCYNLLSAAFVAVGGTQDATTLPTSPPTTGAWTPPSFALVATKVMVTHPGFTVIQGAGKFFGWIDITNPAAPTWNVGNLTGLVQFTTVPSAVANFAGRAYYIHNNPTQPAAVFSDILVPTNVTNANQILTFNDNVSLTAFGGLQLNSQIGGIIQSLMVFKGVQNIYQVTGDYALNNLTVNTLNVVTGTLAPNSVQSTPKGLAFAAPDGMRIIDFQARVSDPIGYDGQGVTVPFVFAVVPSRINFGCNGSVLRASLQNGNKPGTPNEEYWYDFSRGTWSGPHTFPFSMVAQWNNTFVITPLSVTHSLWQSDPVQSLTSQFVENGVQLTWNFQTPFLPDTDRLNNVGVTETSLMLAFGLGTSIANITAFNQNEGVITAAQLSLQLSDTVWNAFTWGGALWGGTVSHMTTYPIPWPIPIVANRLAISVQGTSAQGVKLGSLHLLYQTLRYLVNPAAAA